MKIIKELVIRIAFIIFLFGVSIFFGNFVFDLGVYVFIIYLVWSIVEYVREEWRKRKR